MLTRTASFFALSLTLIATTLGDSERLTLAQAPAAGEQPAVAAPIPQAPSPAPATAPTPAVAPVEAPVAAAPIASPPLASTPPETPTAVAPPAAPPPAVAVTPPQTETPAIANPQVPPARPEEKSLVKRLLPAARDLFGAKKLPSIGQAVAIGYYPRGCLQGGVELPINGPTWQVMRLSRNRNWGHPSLVRFVERFANLAAKATGWKGVLVGDMAQPRGGPAVSDHMSHQTGLDVDVWFMPMPNHKLSKDERETISAINLVSDDWLKINPKTWTPEHAAFIRTAAQQPEVERVLVNAAIKKELCRLEKPADHSWMAKVRAWYGHHDHIHVRLACPAGSNECKKQPPVPGEDGCSDKALSFWFSDKVLHPKPKVGPPKKPLTMADLPPACRDVLNAPANAAAASTTAAAKSR